MKVSQGSSLMVTRGSNWLIVALFATASCDQTARVLNLAKRPFDPLVGEWRQVVSDDTSAIGTISFSSNGKFSMSGTIRKQPDNPYGRALLAAFSSLSGSYSASDTLLVLNPDYNRMMRRLKDELAKEALDTLELANNEKGSSKVGESMLMSYSISGDVLTTVIREKSFLGREKVEETIWTRVRD